MAMNPNVSPADIAGVVQPPATNIRVAEVPSGMPATPTPVTPPADYKKYKGIYDAFTPVQEMQQKQVTGVNDRYAANAADIKNLFGTLTTMREQDKVKIQEQFVNTLVAQQEMLAGRTAEVRKSTQAGVEAAQQAATELGGPATGPVTSLTQQAAERGIAQSNALSTIWQNQMASQNMNTQASIQNQIAGYGGQQAQITKDLGARRENQLMQLQGQQSEIDQQIASAKADYDQAVRNNNAAAARDAANRANQYAIAKMNNATDLEQAKINATNRSFTNDATGWYNRAAANKILDPQGLASSVEGTVTQLSTPTTTSGDSTWMSPGTTTTNAPRLTKAQILSAWKLANPGKTTAEVAAATDYLKILGYN
jgi:hypothetical protein